MMDSAALDAFKAKLKRCDSSVLIAALTMMAAENPDIPGLVENIDKFWNKLRRPRRPGEPRNEPTSSERKN